MKNLFDFLGVIVLCLFGASAEDPQYEMEKLAASVAADFIQFHNFKDVCIISTDSETKADQVWLRWTHRKIISGKEVYVFVQKLYLKKNNESLSNSLLNKRNYNTKLSDKSIQKLQNPLYVLRLRENMGVAIFEEIFGDDEISWLLIGEVAFPPQLHNVYLPLNNMVTLSEVLPETASARFWNVYQSAPSLSPKILAYGHWTSHGYQYDPTETNEMGMASVVESFSNPLVPSKELGLQRILPSGESGIQRIMPSEKLVIQRLKYGVGHLFKSDPRLQRTDLTGLHLSCTTVQNPPHSILTTTANGTVQLSGILVNFFKAFKDITNVTITCREVADGKFGSEVDGNWTGMIGEVVRGEADIAFASIDITRKRNQVVDSLLALGDAGKVISMKRPEAFDDLWSGYTKEFQGDVWLVLAAVVIGAVICLFAILRYYFKKTLLDAAIAVLGFLVGQGTDLEAPSISLRILFQSILVFHVLLICHYTSDFVSQLAAGSPLPSLTLKDMAENPNVRLIYGEGTSIHEYLRDSHLEAHRELWQRNQANNFADLTESPDEGMQKVLQDKNYFFMASEETTLIKFGANCDLYQLPKVHFLSSYSMVVTKGSPLQHIFNKIILTTRSAGLMDRWTKGQIPKNDDCHVLAASAIKLKTATLPFLILVFGATTAILMLCGENVRHRMRSLKSCGVSQILGIVYRKDPI